MKVITEPTVSIFSRPVFVPIEGMVVESETGDDSTLIGAFAAKTAYRSHGSVGRTAEANQQQIIESLHGRILEHINFGLHITGVTRALGNELITHKPGISITQESTRYVSMEDGELVLEPYMAEIYKKYEMYPDYGWPSKDHPDDFFIVAEYVAAAKESFLEYESIFERLYKLNPNGLLEGTTRRKWARGKARNLLPLGLGTSIAMTANLRALRNFIERRSAPDAELEIRRLAHHIFLVCNEVAPFYFRDYTSVDVDGFPHYTTVYAKI